MCDLTANEQNYRFLLAQPCWKTAFDWVKTLTPNTPIGRFHLDGERVKGEVQTFPTLPTEQCRYESHRRYIDLQYCIVGGESIGYHPVNAKLEPEGPFDVKNDIQFYCSTPTEGGTIRMQPGSFAIFFPHDAHAPKGRDGVNSFVLKAVVKIEERVDYQLRLNLGCGERPREGGFVNIDTRPTCATDVVVHQLDDLGYGDDTVDEIYSRHTLEHLPLRNACKALREWNRVLKPGGVIHVVVPNILYHAEQLLKGTHDSIYNAVAGKNDRFWAYGSIFGWNENKNDHHYFGYYFELLRDLLEDFGFGEIEDFTGKGVLEKKNGPWHLQVLGVKKGPPQPVSKFEDFFHHVHH